MSAQDTPTIILGSSSPWRRAVFEGAGIPYEVMSPDIDEKAVLVPDHAYGMTHAIAQAKARALLARLGKRRALVITADQVILFRGQILEKPRDAGQARAFLRGYRRNRIECVTTVVVANAENDSNLSGTGICTVAVGEIPDEAIEQAIEDGAVLNSCGAIVREDPALAPYFQIIAGSSDCCDGLPLKLTCALIAAHRVDA